MKIQNNGFGKNEKVKFPVNFDLKIIMHTLPNPQISIAEMESLLIELHIPFKNWRYKPSTKGTYTSFTVNIDLESESLMKKLYVDLRTIPGFKMAI